MTITETTAPQQIWLPGQVAAPEGPVDMFMMYVMHHGFRRDLAAFAAAVPATPVEDRATWKALNERWNRFANVLHHHHSGEDSGLWPLLLERVDAVGDAAARQTLEAMEAEHEQIDPLLASCAAGFERMARGGSSDDRAALTVRVVAARDSLGRHLAHEETDAIAILQQHLTDADWRALEEEHFQKRATLGEILFAVPWASRGVPDDVRDTAFGKSGAAFKIVWMLTRRGFERKEARTFRYA